MKPAVKKSEKNCFLSLLFVITLSCAIINCTQATVAITISHKVELQYNLQKGQLPTIIYKVFRDEWAIVIKPKFLKYRIDLAYDKQASDSIYDSVRKISLTSKWRVSETARNLWVRALSSPVKSRGLIKFEYGIADCAYLIVARKTDKVLKAEGAIIDLKYVLPDLSYSYYNYCGMSSRVANLGRTLEDQYLVSCFLKKADKHYKRKERLFRGECTKMINNIVRELQLPEKYSIRKRDRKKDQYVMEYITGSGNICQLITNNASKMSRESRSFSSVKNSISFRLYLRSDPG
jgi:hypothetical protein